MEFLCEFDFEIKHVKDKETKVVDALSEKSQVASMSMCKFDLRERVIDTLEKHEHYIQVK